MSSRRYNVIPLSSGRIAGTFGEPPADVERVRVPPSLEATTENNGIARADLKHLLLGISEVHRQAVTDQTRPNKRTRRVVLDFSGATTEGLVRPPDVVRRVRQPTPGPRNE